LLTRPKSSTVQQTGQGHLDFGGPGFAPDSYVDSTQNARARAALERWQTWPGGVFCVFGESGSGKSHLGSMWAGRAGAPIVAGASFDLMVLTSITTNGAPLAVIDNADQCDETALFALLTHLESSGGAVLLIAQTPPGAWPFALPDLKSRLNAVVCEALSPPEPELLAQMIIRHAAARGFKIDEAAATYLANRIPRTFEATQVIVTCMQDVTRTSLKSPKALAQRALQAYYKNDDYADEIAAPDLFDL
jgi:chromosomal replication initiation ATPase DnaA